ncbi:MAG: septum formation protein Maf [Candidatus Eremiobacteraeota bacterium]|nr:septum formation protein Maf [Candidatus Eremiobacteraeota bacterium]
MRELRTVVLASASPRRRELLASLGLRVLVMPTGVDESPRPGVAPRDVAVLHAEMKMQAAIARVASNLVISADTVVDVDGRDLGKPRSVAEAAAMLRVLSGREHLVHTAFVATDATSRARLSDVSTTRVWFVPLSDDDIDAYVATGEALDKAGAYGIQGRGSALVQRIDGDFYTVMGFPLGLFVRSLPKLGLRLQSGAEAVADLRGTARS